VDFRALRDSYATWHAIAGLDIQKLMGRMGHKDYATTLRYAKVAEVVGTDVGTPFAPLPWAGSSPDNEVSRERRAERVGFEGTKSPCIDGVSGGYEGAGGAIGGVSARNAATLAQGLDQRGEVERALAFAIVEATKRVSGRSLRSW
jgi:hypothetical protein